MKGSDLLDRQRSAQAVAAIASEHAERVGKALEQLFAGHWEDGELPIDTRALLLVLGRLIDASLSDLLADPPETSHAEPLMGELQRAFVSAGERLYITLAALRSAVVSVFGELVAERLRLRETLSRRTPDLIRVAEAVIAQLDILRVHCPRHEGLALDVELYERRIKAELAELLRARDSMDAATEIELVERHHHELSRHDRLFLAAADALASLYRLVEEDELASKVAPAAQAPGRTLAELSADERLPIGGMP
ncbi:MAG: hypothetical protein RBU37_17775 [Myxococcota bacterium]|nr:hypothetical protein [Myxococcota bacterium]